jgi:hypothetical protein
MALEVEAINPVRFDLFPPNLLFEFARWQVTCGFCRTRFRRTALDRTAGSRLRRDRAGSMTILRARRVGGLGSRPVSR